jgi:hypothetical protein
MGGEVAGGGLMEPRIQHAATAEAGRKPSMHTMDA